MGRVYRDVKVLRSEPDAVTILYRDGGALIPLANLPPDVQKRFHYDPVGAEAAAQARAQVETQNAAALRAEKEMALKKVSAQAQGQTSSSRSPSPSAGQPRE